MSDYVSLGYFPTDNWSTGLLFRPAGISFVAHTQTNGWRNRKWIASCNPWISKMYQFKHTSTWLIQTQQDIMYSWALLYTFLYTCELIYCTLIIIGIDFHDFLHNFRYLSKDIHSRALRLGLLLFEGSIPQNYLMIWSWPGRTLYWHFLHRNKRDGLLNSSYYTLGHVHCFIYPFILLFYPAADLYLYLLEVINQLWLTSE